MKKELGLQVLRLIDSEVQKKAKEMNWDPSKFHSCANLLDKGFSVCKSFL